MFTRRASSVLVVLLAIAAPALTAQAQLGDTDGDCIIDALEATYGTSPVNADSDGDGLTDGCDEVNTYGTDPANPDTDGDTLSDGFEVNFLGTNPLNSDTDGDGMPDQIEGFFGTDPLNPDTDGDGLNDSYEVSNSLNPRNPDSDADGLSDGNEVNNLGTNPLNPDSDFDGLSDGNEVNNLGTNPLSQDTDADGLTDGNEVNNLGTNPNLADSDADGLDDPDELNTFATDPLNPDTDADAIGDGDEVNTHGTDPNLADSDADGLLDGTEILNTQYASSVIAFSSQYSAPDFGAEQALGPPDTFEYNDIETAWAPFPPNGSLEFITLGFTNPASATGLTIRETWGNGFVYQVDLLDESAVPHTVWTGTDPSLPGAPADFEVPLATTAFLTTGVKIYVDTDHDLLAWEEIDSVTLHFGLGTNPLNPDSDGDGSTDGDEVNVCGTDPLNAAESCPPPCPADTNADGILDNGDIGFFVGLFLAGDTAADFNADGILDNGDISAFVAAFLAGC